MKFQKITLLLISTFLLFSLASIPASAAFSGSSDYQAYQPTIDRIYSSEQQGQFWPILGNLDSDQCEANTDFIIGIPPGGCGRRVGCHLPGLRLPGPRPHRAVRRGSIRCLDVRQTDGRAS